MAKEQRKENLDAMQSSRSAGNPAARLLEAARDLFYEQGYTGAGINDIIARSNTSKKSFYRYFPTKQKLGEAYLKWQTRDLIRFLDWLESKAKSYDHFCDLWARSMIRISGSADYRGCPFSNAMAQAPDDFQAMVRDVHELTVLRLQEILKVYKPCKDPGDGFRRVAEGMLIQYLGAVHVWKLSGNQDSFKLMGRMMKAIPGTGMG
ncbi:MAG: hypothetical protein CMN77_14405 [Spirochaetaceae bacterium]|nr:hypothetical protein [Spirochaetaceae bacterium]|tara:strand:+ start:10990 stop:11607 length:618 start_codon:yes stop_codon:yes gene_type:complete